MVPSNLNLRVNKKNIEEARNFRVILGLSLIQLLTNSDSFFLSVNPMEPSGFIPFATVLTQGLSHLTRTAAAAS